MSTFPRQIISSGALDCQDCGRALNYEEIGVEDQNGGISCMDCYPGKTMSIAEFDLAKAEGVRTEIEHLTNQLNRRGWDMPGSSIDPRTRFERLCEAVREWTFFEQVAKRYELRRM